MSEENNLPTDFDLTSTSAFENYNEVSTSFTDGLEKSILELAKKKDSLLMSDILERFGNYEQVHKQIKRMVLENKLVLYELEPESIHKNKFKKQKLTLSNPKLSSWVDLAAQPCLTCPIYNECGLDNPVSPATCQEFNDWLEEEIVLEFPEDEI